MRNEWFAKVWQGVITLVLSLVVGLQIWLVNNVQAHDVRLAKFEEWKSIGPRFTPSDAESLRLKIMAETADKLAPRLDRIEKMLNEMAVIIAAHTSKP